MAKLLASALVAWTAMIFAAHAQGQGNANLDCAVGPLSKTYGGTPWLVYGCSDAHSLAVMAQPGSPASPFTFLFHWENGEYRVRAEGTGDKTAANLAAADLRTLTASDIQALLAQTRSIKPGTGAP